MGCSCNKSANRTNSETQRQVSKPRGRVVNKPGMSERVKIMRRALERY